MKWRFIPGTWDNWIDFTSRTNREIIRDAVDATLARVSLIYPYHFMIDMPYHSGRWRSYNGTDWYLKFNFVKITDKICLVELVDIY